MANGIEDILEKRRNRSIALILSFKENECDRYLPDDVSHKLRKTVLDQVNDLHDLAVDLLRSVDDGTVILNEEYLKKIDYLFDRLGG
jgi:hypothetical protein